MDFGLDGLSMEVLHYVRCIRGEAMPALSTHDARRALEIVLAARTSADEGRKVLVSTGDTT